MLTPVAQGRLEELIADIARDPRQVRIHFPAAAREVGRGPVADRSEAVDATPPRIEDRVRGELLLALANVLSDDSKQLSAEVNDLYRFGDADEKRAVLLTLHRLPLGGAAVPLVEDALRTNDTRLVAAAMGPYGTAYLPDASWRQGVLKCLFVGVPLAAVHGLRERRDPELVRMVSAYVCERQAAGRAIPPDALLLLDDPSRPRET